VKTVLNHNSFYAAVGMAEVLCDYSAQQTIEMYDLVTRSRAEHKDWAACSHARLTFLNNIVRRFGDRVELRKEGTAHKLNWRRPTTAEAGLLKRSLTQFLPPLSPPPEPAGGNGFLMRFSPFLQESFTEMNRIYRFLDPEQFKELPAQILSRGTPEAFEDHLRILDRAAPAPTDPDSGSNLGDGASPGFDLDRLRDLIKRCHNRRRRLAPGSLSIRVDGVDRGIIDIQNPSCDVVLEEGASVVKLMGRDYEQASVTVATYLLTYGSPKAEFWEADIPGMGRVRVTLDFRDDESVSASFGLQSEFADSYDAIGIRENDPTDDLGGRLTHDAISASLEDGHRVVLAGGFGGGKTGFAQIIAELLRHAKDALVFLEYCPTVLRSRFSPWSDQESEHEAAVLLAQASYRALREGSMTDKAAEIDKLVDRQSAAFDEFLTRAQAHQLSIEPTPSTYEPHAKLSRIFGPLAILFGLCEGVAFWFLGTLLDKLGVPITGLAMISGGLAIAGSAKMWWNFGWSLRLSRKYYQAEHLITLLRADLNDDRIEECAESRSVVDWRGFPLARTLGWLLRSRSPEQANGPSWFLKLRKSQNTNPWVVNTVSEEELVRIISGLGEERRARRIARAIVRVRPFVSTIHLAQALGKAMNLPASVARAVEASISGTPDPERNSTFRRDERPI